MKVFNALQLVILFAAWPFIIQWLAGAEFRGSGAAFYAACACYLVQMYIAVVAHVELLEG